MTSLFRVFIFYSIFHSLSGYADEFRPLFRGTRAMAMGGAFTAIADDEQAIFYNPAGLAGVENFTVKLVTADIDISTDVLAQFATVASALASPTVDTINTLMGRNIYIRGQGTASVVIPNIGIAGIFDQQWALRMKNSSLPQTIYGNQTTYGAQAGLGFRVLRLKRRKGELRVGAAGKILFRGGGYTQPGLTDLLSLNMSGLTRGPFSDMSIGYGLDVGTQFLYNIGKNFTLMAGLAMKDIGNTSFSTSDPIMSNLTGGLAVRYKYKDVTATLAYDYSHILDSVDWRKKNHFGLELKFPAVAIFGGFNQVYLTYGASVDLWIMKFMYVSYAEEQGTVAQIDGERRHLLQMSIKFDL